MNLLKNIKRVAVGVSGGVDSAVAAYQLKRQGFDVVGVFMKNWDLVDETGYCSSEDDLNDAKFVCHKLQIPFHEANFVKTYWNEVFENLIESYKSGMTPNPDILCNKFIKFDRFRDWAFNVLGCDMIATGHYAKRTFPDVGGNPRVRLLKARDPDKDQTFFLSQIPQSSLQKTLFPLGEYLKTEVKKIAAENGLERIVKKKESMGMCFIGNRNFDTFIEDYIESKEGNFVDIDTGKIFGRHSGKHHFTLGQRCRLGGFPDRLYIAKKNENEDIYVVLGHDHPILFSRYIFTSAAHWIHSTPRNLEERKFMRCKFRFQHRNPLIGSTVLERRSGELVVILDEPLRALTPGQYAVFYDGDECLGSSRISYVGPSEYVANLHASADSELRGEDLKNIRNKI